jgi:hypothetical protein
MNAAVSEKQEESTVTTVSTVSVGEAGVTVSTVKVTSRWAKTFHHKTLARSIGAIASLAGALSVLVGALAARMAPHGWSHVKMALHLTKKPLLLQLAPFIAGFAVTAATVAGLLSFYSWYREGAEQRRVSTGTEGSEERPSGAAAGSERGGPRSFAPD